MQRTAVQHHTAVVWGSRPFHDDTRSGRLYRSDNLGGFGDRPTQRTTPELSGLILVPGTCATRWGKPGAESKAFLVG